MQRRNETEERLPQRRSGAEEIRRRGLRISAPQRLRGSLSVRCAAFLLAALVVVAPACTRRTSFAGGTRIELELVPGSSKLDAESACEIAADVMRRRLESRSFPFRVETAPKGRVIIELPSLSPPERSSVVELVTHEAAEIEFVLVSESESREPALAAHVEAAKAYCDALEAAEDGIESSSVPEPPTLQAYEDAKGSWLVIDRSTEDNVVRSSDIARLEFTLDSNTMKPTIGFEMASAGAAKLGALTGAHLGERIAILVNDRLVSAPVVSDRITRNGNITGDLTEDEIRLVVATFESGPLPGKFRVVSRTPITSP